ncbi:MAG: hypothetical protein IJ071_04705 [Ruminococcus sp.]|nr:hypothetical protein [Ruminococcus sp.]
MDMDKMLAIVLAIVAAFLVMWAGKSCAEDIASKQKGSGREPSISFQGATGGPVVNDNGYLNDAQIAGDSSQDLNDAPVDGQDQPDIEYVTDLLGRVESTIVKETLPPDEGEAAPKATEGTKSILDEYNEQQQQSGVDPISGFNHGSGGNSSGSGESSVQEDPTLPPDFALVLN